MSFSLSKHDKKDGFKMTETTFTIQKAKKPRHQLRLPQPYFVVVDDWLDKLGEKSYLMWFKLLAKVDRTDESKDTVKYTQQKLAKSLGITKPTLITHLKSLYEYGFIDYKEYQFENGNVGENIIVYEAPQNDEANLSKPLEKVREWENRTNEKFDFTKKGGRPKKEVEEQPEEQPQEPKKPEQPEPVVTDEDISMINALDCQEVIKTEYMHFRNMLIENKVDLVVFVKWISKNHSFHSENAVCHVINNLATFPEEIQKTSSFLSTALSKVSAFHQPITQKRKPISEVREEVNQRSERRVPFYNWLEE
jgi:DNA-binding Lrp family transcriptional regulator